MKDLNGCFKRESERDDCLDMNNCNNRKASFVFNIKVVAMIKSFYFRDIVDTSKLLNKRKC